MNIYIIIFLVVLSIIICIKYAKNNNVDNNNNIENFNLLDTGIHTNDCYSKSIEECGNYSNCGIALIDGRKVCNFGDEEGPYFNVGTKFQKWAYKDKYDKFIFNETDEMKATDIWSTFYPQIYDVFFPSPVTNAALF